MNVTKKTYTMLQRKSLIVAMLMFILSFGVANNPGKRNSF